VIALCLAIVFGIVRLVLFRELQFGGRLTVSATYNPSWLAAQAGVAVLLSATMLADVHKRRGRGALWIVAGSISLLGLLMTQGRNALLALSIVGAAFLGMALARSAVRWTSSGRLPRSRFRTGLQLAAMAGILAAVGLLGLIGLATKYPELVSYARLLQLTSGDASLATAGRTDTWRSYVWILGQSNQWIVGWGVWSAPFVYFTWFLDLEPPHNTFLSVLVELGIVGLALYLAAFVTLAANTYRLTGVIAQGARAVLAYAFLLSFGNDMLTYKYFWLTVTLSIVLAKWAESAADRQGAVA
jgi:O-antigen ligase